MTHLRIELNNIQENVSSAVIEKLYNICYNDTLDNTSNLAGLLHTDITYRAYITYLTTMFPELTVTADAYAIPFEDPNMAAYLNSIGVGSNGMVTEDLAAAATIVANSVNTTVTKFNELRYFTNITGSRGGWTGNTSGFVRFAGWTALEEVDISNFTSLGHNNGYGYEDTFTNCSSLKTVTASDKLDRIGSNAFYNCQNLETISGLSGNITLATNAFFECLKLTDASFLNVTSFDFVSGVGRTVFFDCKLITTIPLNSNVTSLERAVFENCSALTTIDTHNITNFGERCFMGCTSLATIDLSSCTILGDNAFSGCTNLSSINLPTGLTTIGEGVFNNCSSLSSAITIQNTVTYIGNKAFYNCRNIPSITFQTGGSNTLTFDGSLWDGPFRGTYSINKIIFPENLSSLAGGALNIANDETKIFVFTSITPPSVTGNGEAANALGVNQNGHTIYVPDSSVTAYQNALGSNLSGKIYPVSQMPT